jgi:hypothetical protein
MVARSALARGNLTPFWRTAGEKQISLVTLSRPTLLLEHFIERIH